MGIFDLSRVLAGTGMNHHVITASVFGDAEVHEVVAGRREAATEGQEQFVNVIIKSNSNGQSGVAWLAFLKRIGVKPNPIELTAPVTETNATGKRYCYIDATLMANASIFILCEYRPDRAVHERPIGYAGLVHVIVFDTAKMKFGAIRSALRVAARTGVPAVYARKSHADNVLDQAMKNPERDVEAIVRKQAYDDRLHNETMKAIRELRKGSIQHEELSDLYNAKKSEIAERWKKEGMLPPTEGGEATGTAIHFKTSSERAKQRRLAKLYRQKNKTKIKLKAKAYRKKMKHRKPNALRSRIAKLIAKHYHRG